MTIRDARPGDLTEYAAGPSAAAASEPAGLPSPAPTSPYWLQSPSQVLLGHRTTPALPASADVVIVGSGITGAFAADALVGRGLSVLLLEAREACYGATGRNGGHCQPMVYGPEHDVTEFELATFRFLRDFVEANQVPCHWRTLPGGGVHAYLDEALFGVAAAAVAKLQAQRPDLAQLARVVTRDTTTEPTLADLRLRHAAGAIHQTHAASVWPYKLVAWVLERLVTTTTQAGTFNLQTSTPVLSLAPATETAGWSVHTARGTVAARAVLLATNAYTSHLLPAWADLIVPVRGQVAALVPPSPDSAPSARGLDRSYVFLGDSFDGETDRDEYLVQCPGLTTGGGGGGGGGGGHLVLGGGRHRAARRAVGEWRDDALEPDVARYLRTHLTPVLDLGGDDDDKELAADYEWTGIMGFSRDQHPWVGPVPSSVLGRGDDHSNSGLYLAAGFTGHGMPSAALSGGAVARDIVAALGTATPVAPEADDGAAALPASFRISAARVAAARALPTVSAADAEGMLAEYRQMLAAF